LGELNFLNIFSKVRNFILVNVWRPANEININTLLLYIFARLDI